MNFVAWDGEGITSCGLTHCTSEVIEPLPTKKQTIYYHGKGCHKYALLMNSRSGSTPLISAKGLDTLTCFEYLLDESAQCEKDAIHVVYGGSYDVNMMCMDFSYEEIRALHDGYTVVWRKKYHVTYHARKMFALKCGKRSILLWDVLGFFQGRFTAALQSYLGEDYELLPLIEQGKAVRGTFTDEQLRNFVVQYTRAEVTALVALMNRLAESIHRAGISITSWYGSGAISKAFLKEHHVEEYLCRQENNVEDAGEYAYFGGRIEALLYGVFLSLLFHYDINSAYPFSMLHIPSLVGGTWHTKTRISWKALEQLPDFSLVLVKWDYSRYPFPFYPFPYRTPENSILFPRRGYNWLWVPEVKAALACYPHTRECVQIKKVYSFEPATQEKPFAFLRDLYEERKKLVLQKDGAEKVMKLGYNGMYGATAQKAGYLVDEHTKYKCKCYLKGKEERKPPYHQLLCAGFTTSYTRSMMLRAAMTNPYAVISFATDGIYATEPLQVAISPDNEKELGKWSYQTHQGITIVQSGVYWLHNTPDKKHPGMWSSPYYRGFDMGTLDEQEIIHQWKQQSNTIPYVIAPSTRFMTMGCVVSSEHRYEKYHTTWYPLQKVLYLDMSHIAKRIDIREKGDRSCTLVKTEAREHTFSESFQLSQKHKLPWNEQRYWNEDEEDDLTYQIEHEESHA